MEASTSSRDGLDAPVCWRKCPNKGSSMTLVSCLWAKLYMVAVLPVRGPAHKASVQVMCSDHAGL